MISTAMYLGENDISGESTCSSWNICPATLTLGSQPTVPRLLGQAFKRSIFTVTEVFLNLPDVYIESE